MARVFTMYVQCNRSKVSDRVCLYLIHRGVNPMTGKSATIYNERLGYVDELQKEYPDPVTHFRGVAEAWNKEMEKYGPKILLEHTKSKMSVGTDTGKNLGYAAASCLYHRFGIDKFLHNRQRHTSEKFDASTICQLLLYSRLICADSNKSAYEHR